MSRIENRLKEMKMELPVPGAQLGSYIPAVRSGNLVFTSGQLPIEGGSLLCKGKVGREVTIEDAYQGARLCVLNGLAAIKTATGDLDTIKKVVKVTGFVASADGFTDQPKVVNGASDLLTELFGEAVGTHARSAVGVFELPLGAAVEIELVVEVGQ